MKHSFLLVALLAFFLRGSAVGQEAKFVYQGRVTEAGSPAEGSFEMEFKLFDAPEVGSGTQQGETITASPVEVSAGTFTVNLDFGVAVFDGGARFLEISVRRAGAEDPLSVLSPRQAINPVPYAVHSVTASRIEGASGSFLQTDSAGHLGIGTTEPKGALQVANGGLAVTGHSSPYTGAGEGIFMESSSTGGFLFAYDYGAGRAKNLFLNSPGGRVGIGTLNPGAKLTVQTSGSAFDRYGIEHTDGTVRLTTFLDGSGGWLGTRGPHALNFFINDDLPSLAIEDTGNVVVTPHGGAGGYGRTVFGAPNGEGGMTLLGANRADIRFNGSALKLVAGPGAGPPGSEAGVAISTSGNVGIGTVAPAAKLEVAGNALVRGTTTTCVLEITGGCDLAEPFPLTDQEVDKGTVMVIDDELPGHLKRSARPYDTRVAGVVSGAGGINTGIALRQQGELDHGQNIALTGRVYVKADASDAPITPGDLLTTSAIPGHAMKVTDHGRAQGAILGKAMSRLDEGQGLVLVLVTLQ